MANERIKDIIQGFEFNSEYKDFGKVISIFDGIAVISGLQDIEMEEIVIFKESKEKGIVIEMNEDTVSVIVLGDFMRIKAREEVKGTKEFFKIPVSEAMIGRVFDGFGNPIDNNAPITSTNYQDVEADAVPMILRSAVNRQLVTGIKIIDCLIPIGRGQRQLIVGDMNTGKSSIGVTTMISQKNEKNVVSIYVSIGQEIKNTSKLLETLNRNGVKNFIIIIANCSDSAAMRYYAPLVGCAIGEYFRDRKKDAIVIYDNLSSHAMSYREISLILKRTPGREAYPGDMFYIHAKLLERATQLKDDGLSHGGSLTALPICETLSGDISSYISTSIISITDGQIFLDQEEFLKNCKPAIKIGVSVSRVGGACQYPIVSKLAGSLKMELAQYEDLLEINKLSSNLSEDIKKTLQKGALIKEFLFQGVDPEPIWKQILLLFGLKHNLFQDSVSLKNFSEEIKKFEGFESKIIESNEEYLKKLLEGKINV